MLTLRASVMSPAALGGGYCEDAAGLVCQVLGGLGGICVQEGCENVSRTELLCVRVTAVFRQEEQVRFSVSVGGALVAGADSFAAWRSKQDTETSLEDAAWHFRLEAQGVREWPASTEPFDISVERNDGKETYTGCILTSQRVEADPGGARTVWEGTAQERAAE